MPPPVFVSFDVTMLGEFWNLSTNQLSSISWSLGPWSFTSCSSADSLSPSSSCVTVFCCLLLGSSPVGLLFFSKPSILDCTGSFEQIWYWFDTFWSILEYSRTFSFRSSLSWSLSRLCKQSRALWKHSIDVTTNFSSNTDSGHGSPFRSLDKYSTILRYNFPF